MASERVAGVAAVRYAPICKLCRRDLIVRQAKERGAGKVEVELVCPKHGRVKRGERYLMAYVPDERRDAVEESLDTLADEFKRGPLA